MAQQLKKEERIKIQTLLENGSSIIQISKYLGRNRSTIHRELNRAGVVSDKYDAQMHHEQARKNMARRLERAPCKETISFIEAKILEQQWSPEQISNWLKINKQISVSHTWIYRYIAQDKKQGGELHNHMRRGTYLKGHKEYKGKIKDRVSIEERADVVNKRERLGDYEIDLIVGPKNKGAILTVIDRLSRFCVLKKLTSKNKEEVATEVITSLAEYKPKTITSDNGTEFTDHQDISKALNLKYYFAHPYASYERGSIENLNGLVRQYIPKGLEFDNITDDYVKLTQEKLNNRPRKILGFLSPIEYIKNYSDNNLENRACCN